MKTAGEVALMLVPLINRAGCCLHVQVADGNLHDRFFDAEAEGRIKHRHCRQAFDALKGLRQTARRKARAIAYDSWVTEGRTIS